MNELSVLGVKKGTKKVDLFNKPWSLKTSLVLEKSLNFVCLKLYEPCVSFSIIDKAF